MSMFTDVTRMSTEDTPESGKQYNTEQTRATRLKIDTERDFIDYKEEHNLSDAEALRRLTREALDDTDETLDTVQKLSIFGAVAYVGMYAVAGFEAAGTLGGLFIALMLLWSTLSTVWRFVGGSDG